MSLFFGILLFLVCDLLLREVWWFIPRNIPSLPPTPLGLSIIPSHAISLPFTYSLQPPLSFPSWIGCFTLLLFFTYWKSTLYFCGNRLSGTLNVFVEYGLHRFHSWPDVWLFLRDRVIYLLYSTLPYAP